MEIVWPSALRGTDYIQCPLETIYQTSRGIRFYPLRIPILSEYFSFQHLFLHIVNNCISLLWREVVLELQSSNVLLLPLPLSYWVNYIAVWTFLIHSFNMSWHNSNLQNQNQGICYCMIHWVTDALLHHTRYFSKYTK